MDTLTCAIIGHLVGDYLLQNDWMAKHKKRATRTGANALALHSILWSVSVMFFTGWWTPTVFAVLGITHVIQDGGKLIDRWMRLVGQKDFMQADQIGADLIEYEGGHTERRLKVIPGLGPWSIIVVDNVWHIVTLWAVWKFVV
jgi:hypothetical protein